MQEGYCEEKDLLVVRGLLSIFLALLQKLALIMKLTHFDEIERKFIVSLAYHDIFHNIDIDKHLNVISSFEIKCFDGRSSHSFQITGISQTFFTHFFMMAFSSHATHAEC